MTIAAEAETGRDEDRVAGLVERLLDEHPPSSTDKREFLGAQFDAGLAWIHFDEGHGGLGLNPGLQKIVQERLAKAGAPHPYPRNPIGYGMGAPTVFTHGSEEQRARYLRPLFTGEEVWCQLFSEPGAGSDVASLATRAVRDGDEWVVNGQKVWTTLAHLARFGMLVARTDPSQPKHKGMTYFVVDMHDPGVEVRPLRQITGEAEFNEVYFTDVRIPDAERLGDIGEGWRVSLTTLMNERVSIGGSVPGRGSGPDRDGGAGLEGPRPRRPGPARRADAPLDPGRGAAAHQLAGVAEPAARHARTRGLDRQARHGRPQQGAHRVLGRPAGRGRDALRQLRDEPTGHGDVVRQRAEGLPAVPGQLDRGRHSEVMRNILGERVLGLPGDVRTDRELPWSEVPRS